MEQFLAALSFPETPAELKNLANLAKFAKYSANHRQTEKKY